ncbi:toll/interleukin-1 receptor domain-containing protein [Spirosoma pollinicola]|uniref:Toll-Interleukin receptor n=1 Tax=Spirosoma pollinicola TaxID=2057025 RepID=A0A2K8YTK9_9BACT|nr:toll/interleukin-1 receptor domain-containing protein [Spirosoma pollinicola]AUD00957.1 toll-Interleukin receptor [Spirosoma pollinicola]
MKVFISWSGVRSQHVAEIFKVWLKCVLQASDPWVSTQDIESGSLWFTEIGNQLSETSIGIICLTKENKDKPWILFEAGALTKGLSTSRVIPFLVDLMPQDLMPPLSQLNATSPDKTGLYALAKTINLQLKEGQLTSEVFARVFETYWPQFEADFAKVLNETPEPEKVESRKDKDILSEILLTVRGFDKRIRQLEKIDPTVTISNAEFNTFKQSDLEIYLNEIIKHHFEITGSIPEVGILLNLIDNDIKKFFRKDVMDNTVKNVLANFKLGTKRKYPGTTQI